MILAGFKGGIHFTSDPLGDGSQEIQIDLGQSITIASIFVISRYYNNERSKRFGSSQVWIGDDATPWSTSLTLATAEPINEGGFINLDTPVKGRYVVLRRDGYNINGSRYYIVNEIKVYSVTNLLNYGATILSAPEPT